MKMTSFEYEFMTGKWEGVKGAAYNATAEFCQDFGWMEDWADNGMPIPTPQGYEAMEEYAREYRFDVV